MPQSLAKIYIHLVFSTKNRAHVLPDEIRAFLKRYEVEFDEHYVWD